MREETYSDRYYAAQRAEREQAAVARLGVKLTPAEIKLLHMPFREVRMPRLTFLEHRLPWEARA